MAGITYYQKKPYFKGWQRVTSGFALAFTSLAIGLYFQRLVELRYSRFRGRTALHGEATVRNGWLDVEAKD